MWTEEDEKQAEAYAHSFVRTPLGVVMHVDNHRELVKLATSKGQRLMLEPATPIDASTFFGDVDQTEPAQVLPSAQTPPR